MKVLDEYLTHIQESTPINKEIPMLYVYEDEAINLYFELHGRNAYSSGFFLITQVYPNIKSIDDVKKGIEYSLYDQVHSWSVTDMKEESEKRKEFKEIEKHFGTASVKGTDTDFTFTSNLFKGKFRIYKKATKVLKIFTNYTWILVRII